MNNNEEIRKLAAGSAGVTVGPIVGIMLVHQHLTQPFISSSNLIRLAIAAVAAAISAAIAFKISLRLSARRPRDSLTIGAGFGAGLGSGLYLLLTEVVKQLQQ